MKKTQKYGKKNLKIYKKIKKSDKRQKKLSFIAIKRKKLKLTKNRC